MKQRFRKSLYRFLKSDGLTVIFSGIILFLLIVFVLLSGKRNIDSLIDVTIFSSIVVAMILNSLSGLGSRWLINWLEDDAKLTTEYDLLMSKYQADMYSYSNHMAQAQNLAVWKKGKNLATPQIRFPVISYIQLSGCPLEIQDNNLMYQLPDQVQDHFDEIFSSHSTSHVYNQLNIRVDDWTMEGRTFRMYTSRTTYYNSLVTNRAMDYQWSNGVTIRDILEYGPFPHTLSESKLSNHLGFNGFVISSDDYIPFVKRSNHMSVGKNTYGTSVSASLKVKYALEGGQELNLQGLSNAILREVQDELKIPPSALEEFVCSKNVIAAYRDLVEGGKPQLLVCLKSLWSKECIQQHFSDAMSAKKNANASLLEDGSMLVWIHRNELPMLCLGQNMMIHHGKIYPMTHSAAASVGMFVEYLIRTRDNYGSGGDA